MGHTDYNVILQCKNLVAQWLEKVGLELKPEKTSIRHTLKSIVHNGKTIEPGFDFPGFNTLIKPSKKKILAHHEAIKEAIKANKKAPQKALITRLNPIIRGWCNYYRNVC